MFILTSLVDAEHQFAGAAKSLGMRDAFLAFLADDGIIFRPRPVNGKQWFFERPPVSGLLLWTPAFVDLSNAGDLGYTTGPWEFREAIYQDASACGIYVSVWKQQADGTLKVVMDAGVAVPSPISLDADWTAAASTGIQWHEERPIDAELERRELLAVDQRFSAESLEQGLLSAYQSFASDDVRICRTNVLPLVKRWAAREILSAQSGNWSWEPHYADVSCSADMGYTYGIASSSRGDALYEESYLRIWKKERDTGWKVVLDLTNPITD